MVVSSIFQTISGKLRPLMLTSALCCSLSIKSFRSSTIHQDFRKAVFFSFFLRRGETQSWKKRERFDVGVGVGVGGEGPKSLRLWPLIKSSWSEVWTWLFERCWLSFKPYLVRGDDVLLRWKTLPPSVLWPSILSCEISRNKNSPNSQACSPTMA